MAKKVDLSKPNAKSVLYYDKEEMEKFLQGYDSAIEQKMPFDSLFKKFVEIVRKFKKYDDEENLYENKIDFIRTNVEVISNAKTREKFSLWFEDVVDGEFPMELAEDMYNRFVWDAYKMKIEEIDKMDIPFEEKLALRPKKLATNQSSTKVVNLLDIDMTEFDDEGTGYTTGIEELDKLVSIRDTNFIVIAARPGVGKSLMMLQAAVENAKRDVKSMFVSLEMNTKQINERIINNLSGISFRNANIDEDGNFDVQGYNKDIKAFIETETYQKVAKNLQIVEMKSTSGEAIMSDIEDIMKENDYQIVFVDYLQLIKYSNVDEWGSIRASTKEFKNMAFRHNKVIVTGSQVSRSSTEQGLSLTQLFGSSSIESDTDIVIGMEAAKERRQGQDSTLFVKVLKNREGDVGSIKYSINYPTGTMRPFVENSY